VLRPHSSLFSSTQSLLTACAYNLKKLVKYSKGFKEKLKTAADLPILPLIELNIVKKVRDNELVLAISGFKNVLSSFIGRILGFRLAYD